MPSQTPRSQASPAYGLSASPQASHRFSNIPPADTSSIEAFIRTKNGGADPVTALGLRPETADQSVVARDAQVRRELADSLARLANPGN